MIDAKEFFKKIDVIIEQLPEKINKEELHQQILGILLSRQITKKECTKIKGLMKDRFTANSSIEEQAQIQSKIEALCNNI